MISIKSILRTAVELAWRRSRRRSVLRAPASADRAWIVAMCAFLTFAGFMLGSSEAVAAESPYSVGICLSWLDMPPQLDKETPAEYRERAVSKLKGIAGAIAQQVPEGAMKITFVLPSPQPPATMPGPRACQVDPDIKKQKRDFNAWMWIAYDENATFLFEVSKWKNQDLLSVMGNPDPQPDEARTRALLAAVGTDLVGKRVEPAVVPIEEVTSAKKGVIFLYDISGSMANDEDFPHAGSDPDKKIRLGVGPPIVDILAHAPQSHAQPIDFAMIAFAQTATVVKSSSGSQWFQATPEALANAREQLLQVLKDAGDTDLGNAFVAAKTLMDSRKDIGRWHIILLSDGVPTVGVKDYGELTRMVSSYFRGRSTLSVVALYGDVNGVNGAGLAQLVRATADGAGQTGEIIEFHARDDIKTFNANVNRMAFLINGSTARDAVALKCLSDKDDKGTVRCALNQGEGNTLRFGAAKKVTFVADTTGLPSGKCTAFVENQGLGASRQTVELSERQDKSTLNTAAATITLSRTENRMFLTIEMRNGVMNGDWQISYTIEPKARRTP